MSPFRFVRALVVAATLLCAGASHAATLRYLGKIWSNVVPGTLQMRIVLYPAGQDWAGTSRCRKVNGSGRCLFRTASAFIHFTSDGRFSGNIAGGACTAGGSGSPTTALSGSYRCGNGDSGQFYLRRLR